MDAQFHDQVVLVTGGGSGIGQAAAIQFARQGARVGILNRSWPEETVKKIEAEDGLVMPLQADVTKPQQVQVAVDCLVEKWGRIDVLFCNAGVNGTWAPLEELSTEEWHKTFSINVHGTFECIKSAIPHLKKRGGAIVVNSSVNGTRMFSNTGATAYSATKAALIAITKMLALEFAEQKVRVNAVCPGWIETEIDDNTNKRNLDQVEEPVEFPEGKVPLTDGGPGTSDQVADVVLFLSSKAASHVTGSVIYVDGAQSLLQG
ncbi:SDR family oxidoreductase [Bremerella alba]|uniref:Levodione reductase n=1 Tax=Bremerella alba TaxID=980252 RepID=A0A7V9A9J0_9BACT|nr:SDR family NAD(P)-dependent oxidoreductase [Bremerella alba]MBA2117575.1 Levodione reductase [Bremerella alba]